MDSTDIRRLLYLLAAFALVFFYPLQTEMGSGALLEGFLLLQDYVREHTLTCLIPALFIAGAVAAFVSQAAIIKYFAGGIPAWISYSVASVSGTLLAVCSCTVLPLFSSIFRRGAGLGPAVAFLYSGPAINILAIVLTARILGWELGGARFGISVFLAAIIGWLMQRLFPAERESPPVSIQGSSPRPIWTDLSLFLAMIAFLLAATWQKPDSFGSVYDYLYSLTWWLAGSFLLLTILAACRFYARDER